MSESAHAALGLLTLRMYVNLDPYTPVADAPPWMGGLGQLAKNDHGILAVLGPSGLAVRAKSEGRVRVHPDTAALYVAAIADRIRGTKHRIAVGLPPAARHLPLLLAGSAVLANVLDKQVSPTAPSCDDILIVSPDLDVRSRYGDLFVDKVQLEAAYPGSRMRPDGERVPLVQVKTKAKPSGGVCFFLPGLALPQHLDFRPALIVADLEYARWVKRASDLATWLASRSERTGVLALYSLGDDETRNALTSAGYTDMPIDHAAVAACARRVKEPRPYDQIGVTVDWVLADATDFLARRHEVRPVADADEVEDLLAKIGRLLDDQGQRESPDLNRARWLLATMTHLPVPLIWYEQAAQALGRSSLRQLIRRLGTLSKFNTGLGPVLQTLRILFDTLYDRLNTANPRALSFITLLPDLMTSSASDRVLVLVRDRVVERALQDWLALDVFRDADWLDRVDVRSCALYFPLASERYHSALILGAFPRRYRWIAGAALGSNVYFLAYRHEVDVIERQLQTVYGEQYRKNRAQQRNASVAALLGRKELVGGAEEGIPDYVLLLPARPTDSVSKQNETPTLDRQSKSSRIKLTDLAKLGEALGMVHGTAEKVQDAEPHIARWQEDLGGDEPEEEDDSDNDSEGPQLDLVDCLPVHVQSRLRGRGILWLDMRRPVEIYRSRGESGILFVSPSELKPKDILIRVDEFGRSTLFERIVELAEGQPHMEYLAARRRAWQDAVRKMAGRFRRGGSIDYGAMLEAVQRAGAPIQTEIALRYWVEGSVIGPESAKSIAAVGRVVDSEPLIKHTSEFDKAFRQIRGIHQGIGMHLSRLLHLSARGVAKGETDPSLSVLEERLGIAIDELLDTVDFAEVLSVGAAKSAKLPQRVGRFVKDD